MHKPITTLKTDRNVWTPEALLEAWHYSLQEKDRSAGTVKKYTQAVARFLTWSEQEEHAPLTLGTLTPIALIGYRNELQLAQHKSISTINLQVSALRAWMTEQGYLAADPAAHVKLVGGEVASSRRGLKSAQVNALLRQAQAQYISNRDERGGIGQLLGALGQYLSLKGLLTENRSERIK
jgi:site-specific recombinase XerD